MRKNNILKRISVLLLLYVLCALPVMQTNAAAKPKLSASKKTMTVGNTWNLSLKNNKKKVAWNTSKKSVVSIKKLANNTVKLYAKKAGKSTITAKIGRKKYTCKVTVKENPKLNKTSVELKVGQTYDLKLTGTAINPKWSTNKKDIVSITKRSKYVYRLKANKEGTANISVKLGKKILKCKVTVKKKKPTIIKVNKISLKKEVKVNVGKTTKIPITINPSNATNKSVKWTSEDPDIATVDSKGNIKGISEGIATIWAEKDDSYGFGVDYCIVTVEAADTSQLTEEQQITVAALAWIALDKNSMHYHGEEASVYHIYLDTDNNYQFEYDIYTATCSLTNAPKYTKCYHKDIPYNLAIDVCSWVLGYEPDYTIKKELSMSKIALKKAELLKEGLYTVVV